MELASAPRNIKSLVVCGYVLNAHLNLDYIHNFVAYLRVNVQPFRYTGYLLNTIQGNSRYFFCVF